MNERKKIAAQVFSPAVATRNIADEPLTADDWRRVWEARKSFQAAIRQIVYESRVRKASGIKEQSNGPR